MLTKDVATIVFGPSQYGKSTLIARLMMQDVDSDLDRPAIGNGIGSSVTQESAMFQTCIGLMQDNAGYNDTRLWASPSTIHSQAAMELLDHEVQLVQFLVFESLAADSMQLRLTLEQLMETFGEGVKNSVVIVATKADQVDDEGFLKARLDYILGTMVELDIGSRLVCWRSHSFSPEQFAEQINDLQDALQSIPATSTGKLDEMGDQVKARAQELCSMQEPTTSTEWVQVKEPGVEEYTEQVPYEVEEWEKVQTDQGHKMLVDHEDMGMKIAAGFIYTLTAGIGAGIDSLIRECNPPKYEWVPKKVTKHREEVRYKTTETTVWKEVKVDHKKPVSDFMHQAKADVLNGIRASLRMKH